jgi:UDP-N-acetylmuramoyl-tripeptide--D-alanyl-D-alanine ligase
VAFLGTMLELGPTERALHGEILSDALARDLDVVVATGLFAEVAETLSPGPQAPALLVEADPDRAYEALRERLGGGEVVLLKASRGVALERLLPRFEADFGVAGEGA